MPQIVVVALYKFVQLSEIDSLRESLIDLLDRHGVKGSILLAPEGINGAVAGSRAGCARRS